MVQRGEVKSAERQQVRSLLVTRSRLVEIGRAIENQIRAMVKEYRLLFERAIESMFRRKVAELVDAEHTLQDVIAPLLSIHEQVCGEQEKLDKRIATLARADETTRRLMTVPGIYNGEQSARLI
ncbi:hypothetical protein QA646_27335 (plasmid) [Rhizobium sp. CB3090]|uniref:hypothetical protein n=1 Tax=Rhizobium sp. CB3090 TaxID=3039156 RepID=UPI0024B0B13C|nr:hypothetical protein [Rhizobium sp. CB3090]WFU13065.1 hypothetical protein QA646_27335 [Rhizobium sp. CB3090]